MGIVILPAAVEGAEPSSFYLVEPPAGQRVSFVNPLNALEQIARHQGFSTNSARKWSADLTARMKSDIPEDHWVVYFSDFREQDRAHIPSSAFVAWLRQYSEREASGPYSGPTPSVSVHLIDYIARASEVVVESPIFEGPDNRGRPWSLSTLPAEVPPKALIEFVPNGPLLWADDKEEERSLAWREAIRPVARMLEEKLGEQVYHFAVEDDDTDDDLIHRLLVLHCCCTVRPNGPFVQYLVRRSGATNVESLAAALVDPSSYVQSFEMNDAFLGLEAISSKFTYLPAGQRQRVVVAFASLKAREVALLLVRQKIGADVRFVVPPGVVDEDWAQQAAHHCSSWGIQMFSDQDLMDPVGLLAEVDELCVLASGSDAKNSFDLDIPEALEDLLWAGLQGPIVTKFYTSDGSQLWNPEDSLEKGDAPARFAERFSGCSNFADRLQE